MSDLPDLTLHELHQRAKDAWMRWGADGRVGISFDQLIQAHHVFVMTRTTHALDNDCPGFVLLGIQFVVLEGPAGAIERARRLEQAAGLNYWPGTDKALLERNQILPLRESSMP